MSSAIESPSKLAALAAGLQPLGAPAQASGICALCGYAHGAGDVVSPFSPGDTFTDYTSMRGKGSKTVCGWCMATWGPDFTQRYTKSVITRDGVFPAASNDHIAWWLLNPPKGSWVFMLSDQKRQHLIWRAPVNTSDQVYQVRFGELVLTVRRAMLEKGADAARRLAQAASAGRKGAALKSPFVRLSRDIDTPAHGALRHELYEMATRDSQVADDIAVMHSLTPGELWGLTAVLYAATPSRPEPKLVPAANQHPGN
ncbi:type IV CRISPR-associated protein Csf1 [Duganella vulcania]|uniref:Uncharacterized protein n=1 Tax=Duganella vulcania TaxID=2692166 RepID=A0A845GIM9_9BURK|nr:type IV CRISPR-associated protein Csf1 [Duganella vulcania]MYM92617.1 hypothetical protein [Duganella vulcania]